MTCHLKQNGEVIRAESLVLKFFVGAGKFWLPAKELCEMENAVFREPFLEQCFDKFDELAEKIDGRLFAFDVSLDEWLESSSIIEGFDCLPISLNSEPHEYSDSAGADLDRLTRTDNELLRRTLFALSSVSVELKALCHEARVRFLSPVQFYGEESKGERLIDTEISTRHLSISRMLSIFIPLSAFRRRCCLVLRTTVHQLIGLCAVDDGDHVRNNNGKASYAKTTTLPQSVIDAVCDLLYTVATVDHALTHNGALRQDWTNAQQLVHGINKRPRADRELDINLSRLALLENVLKKLHLELFETGLFYYCVNQHFCSDDGLPAEIRPGKLRFTRRWGEELSYRLAALDVILKSCANSRNDVLSEHRKLADILLMIILHHHLSTSDNSNPVTYDANGAYSQGFAVKLAELILRRLPVFCLGSGAWVDAVDFLAHHCPILFESQSRKYAQVTNYAKTSLWSARQSSLVQDVAHLRLLCYEWMAKLRDTICTPPQMLSNELCDFLLRGMTLSRQASVQILAFYITYPTSNSDKSVRTMPKSIISPVVLLCEIIFSVHSAYRAHMVQIRVWCHDLVDYLLRRLQNFMVAAIQRLKAEIVHRQPLVDQRNGSIRHSDKKQAKTLAEQQHLMENLSHMALINNLLNGPMSKLRLACLKVAVDLAAARRQPSSLSGANITAIRQLLRNIKLLSTLPERLHSTLLFDSLYRERKQFMPLFFDYVNEDLTNRANKIKIFTAVCRIVGEQHAPLLHRTSSNLWLQHLEDELLSCVQERLLNPACQQIETALRLHVHAQTLKLPARDAVKQQVVRDFRALVALRPVRIGSTRKLSCKAYIEDYLSHTFYELTAVAPHDWRSYVQMSCAAQQLFGLNLIPSGLPSETLEQGVDVLQIMRRIHVFVNTYSYNLNVQVFVENDISASSKHLNAVGIRHIANSIRTHGLGIMNTTINYTYQFLKKQLRQFSTFLFDEHTKAQLTKELSYMNTLRKRSSGGDEHRQLPAAAAAASHARYPYDRAAKLNRNLRKFGVSPGDNLTQLDRFRQLITSIGNALGFVRTVRSGGMHATYQSARFVPLDFDLLANEHPRLNDDDDDQPPSKSPVFIDKFAKMAAKEDFSNITRRVCADLDVVLRQTVQKFASSAEHNDDDDRGKSASTLNNLSSDYLRLLVDTIAVDVRKAAADEQNRHLQNFFILVPALTVNFVEHMTTCKDKLSKRTGSSDSSSQQHQQAATFCDDGFAMGVAYLLALLAQFSKFDDLLWFDEVLIKYDEERAAAEQKRAVADKLQQTTLILTIKRLDALRKEYQLLMYTLSSARIFFTGQNATAALAEHSTSKRRQKPDDGANSDATSVLSFSNQKLADTPETTTGGWRSGASSQAGTSSSLNKDTDDDGTNGSQR